MAGVSTTQGVARLATILGLALSFASTAFAQHYQQTDLTTNSASVSSTATLDTNLVNAWGLSRSSGSPWWISDNGSGLSTLYDGTGAVQGLVVNIPPPKGGQPPSAPTGTVFNYTTSFEVTPGNPGVFLFVTEDGTVSAWNPRVDLHNAILKADNSKHAIYKGCAIATTPAGPRLYATNFETGRIDVYDGNFKRLHSEEAFEDADVPHHYAPFGIQNVGGNIVVTYAQRDPGSKDENHGPGLGFVRIFDTRGRLIGRLQHGSFLNAPWGIAMAPGDFGPFSHRLLIGNFGDGTINAFNAVSGRFEGTLLDPSGSNLTVGGLWALSFGGNGAGNGSATELYFTAGPDDESNGLFGKIVATAGEQRGNSE